MMVFSKMIKRHAKATLRHLGLYEYALRISNLVRIRPYRNIDSFTAKLDDVTVRFSTEDEYSKAWFFPRYAGGGIHEKAVTYSLVEAVKSAKCFIDVGTHLGWYTCIAAKHMPYGSVYGFEMDDLSFALLKRNMEINNFTNVEVYNAAVFDSVGKVSYRQETRRPSAGLHLETSARNEKSAGFSTVESVILDDFFAGKGIVPDVIKIDVEGAEMNVLMGLRRTLHDHKPLLFLEIHPRKLKHFNASPTAVITLLIEYGYKVFEIENMRNQGSKGQLRPLLRDSMIEKNAMLYVTAAC